MQKGICTLANDSVYDQVVALINSIEVHAGDLPVCIYPYDDHLDKLRDFVAERPQVSLFEDQAVLARWDAWVRQIWNCHPTAAEKWLAINGYAGIHRMGTHRRFCAFEGPFEQFIYMDADTLLLDSPQKIFANLETFDWVTYDFQFKDLSHVFNLDTSKLAVLFSDLALKNKVFCSGFYGAKRESITADDIVRCIEWLSAGEAEVLYPLAPDQTILNYLVLRKPIHSVNLALTLSPEEKTGNSVTSTHFEQQGQVLYDRGKRLTYLHYIGIGSKFFGRLCRGENVDFPYRDIFLNYRYLKHPEERPQFKGKAVSYKPVPPNLLTRIGRKLQVIK